MFNGNPKLSKFKTEFLVSPLKLSVAFSIAANDNSILLVSQPYNFGIIPDSFPFSHPYYILIYQEILSVPFQNTFIFWPPLTTSKNLLQGRSPFPTNWAVSIPAAHSTPMTPHFSQSLSSYNALSLTWSGIDGFPPCYSPTVSTPPQPHWLPFLVTEFLVSLLPCLAPELLSAWSKPPLHIHLAHPLSFFESLLMSDSSMSPPWPYYLI